MMARQGSGPEGRLAGDRRGTALIEFAILLPVLLAFVMGSACYGTWFLTAHTVQQAANEGARAAVAGLSAAERRTLAEGRARAVLADAGGYRGERARTDVTEAGDTLTLAVRYDASDNPVLSLPFVPKPPAVIVRRGTILLGGL